MSDRIDFREVEDNEEKVEDVVEVEDTVKDDDGYEKFCYMCHRPERLTENSG